MSHTYLTLYFFLAIVVFMWRTVVKMSEKWESFRIQPHFQNQIF